MFLHLSVILFTRGVCLSACWDTTPLEAPPGKHTPLGKHTPSREAHPPPGNGCRCGRYASYWNAFLFLFNFEWRRAKTKLTILPFLYCTEIVKKPFRIKFRKKYKKQCSQIWRCFVTKLMDLIISTSRDNNTYTVVNTYYCCLVT